jgi:NTE family protein
LVDYAWSLAETMMEAHDRFYIEETDFDRTIAIEPMGVGTTEFDLSGERALELYGAGRAAAEVFLSSGWDVSSERPRRRDHVHPEL